MRGQVTESVNPSGPQLTSYSLSYQGAGETTFTTFSTSTSTVFPENVLGVWNVTNVPDGEATLRLTANYNNGTTVVEEVAVVVDQLLMSGWPREAADPDYPVYKSPKVADLDGNGVNEIVLGHAVFQADGSVRPGWTSEPGFERPNSAVVDLDGDNRLEVVAVYSGTGPSENYGAPMIRAYNADGFLDAQGQLDWSHAVNNPASSPSLNFGIISSVVAGNVDADPQPEIVYSIYFVYDNPNQDTTLVVLDGASGFVQNQFTVTGISYSTPALADLDNDGVAEIVLPSWRDFDDVNFVHAVNADGTTVAGWPYSFSQQFNIATLTGDPVIGDVDLDGDLEILIGQHLISHTGVSFSADWPVSYIARSTGALAPLSGECESNPILGGGNAVVFWITDLNGSITGHRNKDGEDLNIFYFGGNGDQGTPSVGDVDGNGVLDVLRPPELGWVDGRPSRLYAGSGETAGSVASFPRYVRESNALIRSTATITDLDQDGDTEVLIASSGEIYVWDFPGNYNPNMMPWPMFQHDLQNTGNMGSYYKPGCIAPTAATVSAMQAGVEPSLLVVSLSVAVLLAGVTLGVRRRYQ